MDPCADAECFATFWNLQRPLDEAVSEYVQKRPGLVDLDILSHDLRTDDYAGQARAILDDVLQRAQVTESCKEFLKKSFTECLGYGGPAANVVPLKFFSIDLEKKAYGLFDPQVKVKHQETEENLLAYYDAIAGLDTRGGVIWSSSPEQLEFSKRWHMEYEQKYFKEMPRAA
jgi:hypothetical protein